MTAITFDTHWAIKQLMNKGVSQEQAEVFVDVVRESRKSDLEGLATKADLAELETRMMSTIMNVRREDMRWILGLFLAVIGLLVTILMKLH